MVTWNQIQDTVSSLLREGSKKLQTIGRVLDPERIAHISQTRSRREEALLVLGLTEENLKILEEEKLGKREFIRRAIERSNPSFGRFLTEAFTHYEDNKKPNGTPRVSKVINLEQLKQKVTAWTPETLKVEDILSTCVDLYLLHRKLPKRKVEP